MTPTLRRLVLVTSVAALSAVPAAPAVADIPEGWSDPEPVSAVQLLVVILLIPLAIGFVLALAVYLPAMIRGERVAPGAETADQWFGGPRRDAAELEPASEALTTGGASGRW